MTDVVELVDAFQLALTRAKNERELQPFLKQHKILIRNAFNRFSWNFADVIPEFNLGGDYRIDFLVLSADSGSWNAIFVELKSHKDSFFTKQGIPNKSLNKALRQLDDWERWLNRNESNFREKLSNYLEKIDSPAFCSNAMYHTKGSTEIRDPQTCINYDYYIVMGRRSFLSSLDQERRNLYRKKGREIVTYDRILDVAKRLDENSSFNKKSLMEID